MPSDDERSEASDSGEVKLRVLQVTNISPSATKEQVFNLFSYLGRIDEFKLYPTEGNLTSTKQKYAYIRYEKSESVELGQHLTNTVFIDRAIICIPSIDGVIPDEETCLTMGGPAISGQRQLPVHVTNKVQDMGDGSTMLLTVDPTLSQLGLAPYPPLAPSTEPSKVEEIRRTIYVGNLPKDVRGQEIIDFFNLIGEVMYVRMTSGPDTLPCAYAFVEFSQQPSVPLALQNNGIEFKGRPLRIQHSRVAILKPQHKSADQSRLEVEEMIRRNKDEDARNAPPPGSARMGVITTSSMDARRRSPSPYRSRRRSFSRSPLRDRRRSRSRSRSRRRDRSRSRDRRRSRSRDRDRRRSRSRDHKRRSRSRSRDRRDRDRDRSRDKKKDRKRSRSRSKDRKEKDRKRDRDRSSDRKKEEKKKEEKRDKGKEKEREKEKKKARSPSRSRSRSRSASADDDEAKIRERLLAKVAERNGSIEQDSGSKKNGSGSRKRSASPMDDD